MVDCLRITKRSRRSANLTTANAWTNVPHVLRPHDGREDDSQLERVIVKDVEEPWTAVLTDNLFQQHERAISAIYALNRHPVINPSTALAASICCEASVCV